MNFTRRAIRMCCRNNMSFRSVNFMLEKSNKKFEKVSGVENLINLTRYVKLIMNLQFEDYQREILKLCAIPHKDPKI